MNKGIYTYSSVCIFGESVCGQNNTMIIDAFPYMNNLISMLKVISSLREFFFSCKSMIILKFLSLFQVDIYSEKILVLWEKSKLSHWCTGSLWKPSPIFVFLCFIGQHRCHWSRQRMWTSIFLSFFLKNTYLHLKSVHNVNQLKKSLGG